MIYRTGVKTASVEITFICVFMTVDVILLYFSFCSFQSVPLNNNNVCSWSWKIKKIMIRKNGIFRYHLRDRSRHKSVKVTAVKVRYQLHCHYSFSVCAAGPVFT